MLKELYTGALTMLNQQTRLETTANNLANANVSGFKREGVFERTYIDARQNLFNVKGDAEQDDSPIGSYTDFEQGAFEKTGNALDFVVENPKGFFVLQDANGNESYTKSGHFQLSADGSIRTTDGRILMGESGPIRINNVFGERGSELEIRKALNIKLNPNGELTSNDEHIANVQIANVENPQTLERISNANFAATKFSKISFLSQEEIRVQQGYLENSNINIVREMVEMIELQRMFELGQKVVQTNDGTLDRSIGLGSRIS